MSRKYTQLNNLVTASRDNLHKAYDRGYQQGKKDYQRPLTTFIPEPHEGGIQFRCTMCNRRIIAFYLYCPHCGCKVKEAENDK